MDIEEEKIEKNEIKGSKVEEVKEKNKRNNERDKKEYNKKIDIDNDIIEDIIMETENKNNKIGQIKEFNIKKDEKEVKKNMNMIYKDKEKKDNEKSKNELRQRPIIKREIKKDVKKEINIVSNNLQKNANNELKINESSNINKLPISELWTDKYIPKTTTDIIGNQQQLRNLEIWLDNWDNCILKGHKGEENKTGKKFSKNENINARAVIISGPPGIGKTSSVRVLTKNKGYRTFELNASDKRNKDTINNSVGFLMNNTTLSSIDNSTMTKNIIIMDEVDGMAGNEDKGGIKALIDIVKKQKFQLYLYVMIYILLN